jgi:sugar phosphate isomerase/epimerase
MNRREFLAAGVSLASIPAFSHSHFPARLSRIGLELYSVRDAMKADPEGTLAKIRLMGYDDVELLWSFNNFGRTTEQVRDALKKEGLRAPSAHIAPETLLKDWEKSLETARILGHQYLIVPSLPAETNRSIDAWRVWADRFNNAGATASRYGVWLAFHNEPNHMPPIGGQIPYDVFIQNTDPSVVRLQLDVGNMIMGGGDPLRYLQRYKDRYFSFHIKDITPDRKSDTDLGKGNVAISTLLAAIPDVQGKPCYVEQEGVADPMGAAARNYLFLKNLEF